MSLSRYFSHETGWTFEIFSNLQEDQLGLSLLTVEQVESEEFQKRILQSAVAWFCRRVHLTSAWGDTDSDVDGLQKTHYVFKNSKDLLQLLQKEGWRV